MIYKKRSKPVDDSRRDINTVGQNETHGPTKRNQEPSGTQKYERKCRQAEVMSTHIALQKEREKIVGTANQLRKGNEVPST